MIIKTDILKELVTKAINGASNNKMLPITGLIGIEVKSGKLILTTTDGSNTFRVMGIVSGVEDFYAVVNAEQFSKLVSKTTKEQIELNKDASNNNYLEFKGNGTYQLELALNEEGELVTFPEIPEFTDEAKNVSLNDLKYAIQTAKASVSKTMELPCLTGYYISDSCIATDRQLVCKLSKKITDEPILISSEMAELILLVECNPEDTNCFKLEKHDNNLLFGTSEYIIYGKELEGKEMYENSIVTAINNLTNLEYSSEVQVNKQELLNILDRMSLFVSNYDKNSVSLVFEKDKLIVHSLKSNAQEELVYSESKDVVDYECLIDIEMFKNQLQSLTMDNVTIQYGNQKSIQLKEGNATLVIALLQKAE